MQVFCTNYNTVSYDLGDITTSLCVIASFPYRFIYLLQDLGVPQKMCSIFSVRQLLLSFIA